MVMPAELIYPLLQVATDQPPGTVSTVAVAASLLTNGLQWWSGREREKRTQRELERTRQQLEEAQERIFRMLRDSARDGRAS